jgi:hypothetical protein
MSKLRNLALALCGVFSMALVGLSSAPAGAAPAPLNTTVLEYNGVGPAYTLTLPTTQVSQANGTVTIDGFNAAGQIATTLRITAPGDQQLAPGNSYDSADGATITIDAPGPSGECGNGSQDDASVYVDQAVYDDAGQPTTFGVEFSFDCFGAGGNEYQYNGTSAFNLLPTTPNQGYYLYGDDGSLAGFGNDSYLEYLGDLSTSTLNQPIVGMAKTPDGGGYWMVASDGGIFSFGDAAFYGSTGAIHLNQPIVGMASTPDGGGYWLVASDGGIFSFGDAAFYGSTGAIHLNQPIVGMAATADGGGYWLVASDGGIFSFGDAVFHGSTGALHLNKPIVGMATTPDGGGYWMVATDGGIFSFGDAAFHGSTGAITLNEPIVGMTPTPDGGGYWLAAADGGIFTFGDAQFDGSLGGLGITNAVGVIH